MYQTGAMTLTFGGGPLSFHPPDTAACYYPEPLDGVRPIRGYLCFAADGVETQVDGS